MPGHVKSSLMGVSLNVPITDGRLALGTWQGIYLNEHRYVKGASFPLAPSGGGGVVIVFVEAMQIETDFPSSA
jgi:hypothetical protein